MFCFWFYSHLTASRASRPKEEEVQQQEDGDKKVEKKEDGYKKVEQMEDGDKVVEKQPSSSSDQVQEEFECDKCKAARSEEPHSGNNVQ